MQRARFTEKGMKADPNGEWWTPENTEEALLCKNAGDILKALKMALDAEKAAPQNLAASREMALTAIRGQAARLAFRTTA